MLSLRLTVVSALLMSAIACGGDYSSPPAGPSPTPAPSPAPAGPSSSVTIPTGAARSVISAYSPDELPSPPAAR